MIFKDKFIEANKNIDTEINRLLDLASKNQKHYCDLLLYYINGFYYEEIDGATFVDGKKLNPHTIGPGAEGHSAHAHHSFIYKYRQNNISKISSSEYLEQLKYDPERSKEIDKLVDEEEISIQFEMLLYLKFWEGDLFIKKLYQFARLLNGEHYDWYFKISDSPKDKATSTGRRHEIIRIKVRDKLKVISPILYNLINSSYKSQIRNSIAHSNYSFLGRNIHLNNFNKNDPSSQLTGISFDEWTDMFHQTLALHNQMLKMDKMIQAYYKNMFIEGKSPLPILITEKSGKQYQLPIECDEYYDVWRVLQNS